MEQKGEPKEARGAEGGVGRDSQGLVSQLAETARCETALRRALLAALQNTRANAMCPRVKLLGASSGGFDPRTDLLHPA